MEVANHPAHDRNLLRVLLAEVGAGRADEVEELAADRRHPTEVAGPRRALEAARELLDVDPGLVARRVELLDGGREEDVGPRLRGDARVSVLVTRIGGEVVARVELRGVDEQAHDEEVVLVARGPKQREVALVVGAHRRHEADLVLSRSREGGPKLDGGADEPHRAVASASTA